MKARILTVFGTRPEAIKMAPVVLRLAADARFEASVCVTGQHREMLDSALRAFAIVPEYDLNVMSAGQDLTRATARILQRMRTVLEQACPDMVLVHGDTTTCFAASLAAFYARIPVGHVEAGLRSNDLSQPYPEEMNRRVTDLVSAIHFAPTEHARHNLLKEGVDPERVHVTGNTVIDALNVVRARVKGVDPERYANAFGPVLTPLIGHWPGTLVLVTGHRRESFGDGIDRLCQAIRESAARHADRLFVYPVHPNPRVRGPVTRALGHMDNVILVDPLDYEPFVFLMERADAIVTDSGGIQEEGTALGKPILVTRELTERSEALSNRTRLVGTDPLRIQSELDRLLAEPRAPAFSAGDGSIFGDGRASERIVAVLARSCVSHKALAAAI